jgi:hypothetical protein
MKILVVGEGPGDVGERDRWCDRTRQRVTLPGWLHIVLRKLAKPGEPLDIVALRNRDIVLTAKESQRNQPLPKGHGAKALAAHQRAKIEGFDLLVFMVDCDSKDDREWDRHYSWIMDGFRRLADAPFAAACLPKCASESWLLADNAAWNSIGLTDHGKLPAQPESCWGKRDDPAGNHPHRIFARICDLSGVTDNRETRVDIAELSTMTTIRRKCPKSFATFWSDLATAGFAPPPPR